MFEQTPMPIDAETIRAEAERMLAAAAVPVESDEIAETGKRRFPALPDAAYHGLAGEIVRLIEPHTEADPAALIIQLLAGFGSLIGKTAFFRAGADRHFTKIFAVLVGATATGRKGTSWGEIERLLVRVDGSFQDAIQNGLSSGEGLIFHVRDQQTASKPVRERGGSITHYQDEIVDEGAKDKRAFIIEPEFARVLKVITRDGNTLSSVIRQAWDTDRLSVMTKTPLKATDAHISIVGHITETELLRNLQDTETANGFANRFLWVCVRRSKYLPDGGNLQESDLNEVVAKLQRAAVQARSMEELMRDQQASEYWRRIYKPLSDGFGGLLGSVTSRATAQVLRLACLYALLDCSKVIGLEHLKAAIGVWHYCEDSAKYVFGMSVGDKLADTICHAIAARPDGLPKTDLHEITGHNRTAQEIDSALNKLLDLGRIEQTTRQTGGRPSTIFTIRENEFNEIYEIC